jgi:malonyl CoA-acyl carrier protein transacylase
MSGVAVVFPGQGSQRAGMARDFHDRYAVSRAVFAEAGEALGLDVARLCFDEDPRLDLTEFTQPAILTAEIAMFRALQEEHGLSPQCFGGHSLGEYTALCAAGAIPLAEAVRAVRRRGALMQSAVPAGQGAMVAVLGEGVASRDLGLDGLEVDLANKNSRDQVVLSGAASDMERACERIREAAPAVELVPLAVSAPFHSRRMRAIEPELRATLEGIAPRIAAEKARNVTSNLTGAFHTGALPDLIDALVRQASGAVDWMANMDVIAKTADRIFEIGPNRPLRGFFKSIGREVTSIVSAKAGEKALA